MLKSILCVIIAASALFGQSVFPPASGGGGGSGCVPAGSVGQLLIDSGAGACSSSGDFTISTHTLAGGASAVLDLHLMATSAFKAPGGFATGLVHVTTTTGAMAGGLLVNADIGAASIDPAKLVGGTFGAGNYIFPANVTVGTSLSVDGSTGIASSSKIINVALSGLSGIGKWNGASGPSVAAAADIVGLFSTCSGTQYLGADGACHSAAAGTVTTVGFTGGLVSVANPTTTPAFTVAGTSGGLPYFASASTWASSAAGTAGHLVLWGGAGSAPTDGGVPTTGTVTSIATTGPITGGTITSTGTIACATCGVTGSPLSQFAATTSAQLLATLTNATGSGAAVFGTSPTGGGAWAINATQGSEQAPALTAGNWTVGAGWESPIVGPGLIKNAAGTGTQTPSAATTIVSGTTYKVVITVSAMSVGTASYTVGGATGQSLAAATTYTDYLTATSTAKLIITPTSASRFTISAISIIPLTASTGDLAIEDSLTTSRISGLAATNKALAIGPTNFTPFGTASLHDATATTGATAVNVGYDGSGVFSGAHLSATTTTQTVVEGTTQSTTNIFQVLKKDNSNTYFGVRNTGVLFGIQLSELTGPNWQLSTATAPQLIMKTGGQYVWAAVGQTSAGTVDTGISKNAAGVVEINNGTTGTFRDIKVQNALLTATNTLYNNVATAGMGLPPIYGSVSLTGQTATIGATNIQCGGAVCPAGTYRIKGYAVVTSTGTGTLSTTVGWTDTAAARTLTTTGIATTATNYEAVDVTLRADGIANITYATTLSVSGTYSLYLTLERLQ